MQIVVMSVSSIDRMTQLLNEKPASFQYSILFSTSDVVENTPEPTPFTYQYVVEVDTDDAEAFEYKSEAFGYITEQEDDGKSVQLFKETIPCGKGIVRRELLYSTDGI